MQPIRENITPIGDGNLIQVAIMEDGFQAA